MLVVNLEALGLREVGSFVSAARRTKGSLKVGYFFVYFICVRS